MPNNAERAIKFVAKTGLPVFPVRTTNDNGFAAKAPHISAPYDNSTTDSDVIRAWYKDFHCAFAAHPGRKGYTVVDLDTHGGKDGRASLSDWELDTGCFLPPTLTVRTPSGGEHLWFHGGDTQLTGGKDGLLDGVDVHGGPGTEGRYVLIPGQQIAAGSYTVERRMPPAELPKEIADAVNAARATRQKKNEPLTHGDTAPAGSLDFAGVLDEITSMKPIPEGRRDNTFTAMCLDWKERGFTPSAFVSFLRLMRELDKFDNSDGEYDGDENFNRIANSAWKKASAVFGSASMSALLPSRDKFVTAAEIMRMEIPEPEWLVDKLLPAGALGFIGGNAKSGKTFLCLSLAYNIAAGTPFLNIPVQKPRNVLYIYLEGNIGQVQKRYRSLYGDVQLPENLHFIFNFPVLDAGGITQLKDAIAQTKAELVILDTWQKARIDDGRKGVNAYQKEYRELTKLGQEICTATGCAFMLVHHLKQQNGKTADIDTLNQLNGSAALAGASDFIFILNRDRGADTARLHCHGRDLEDQIVPLVKGDSMLWRRSESDAGSLILTPETGLQQQIVRVLQDAPDEGMTAREIATKIPGGNYNSVAVQLKRWADEGKVDKTSKRYRLFDGSEVEE